MNYTDRLLKEFNYKNGVTYFLIDSNNKKKTEIKIQISLMMEKESADGKSTRESSKSFSYNRKYGYQQEQENNGQIGSCLRENVEKVIKKQKANYLIFCLYADGEEFLIQLFLMIQQVSQNTEQILDLTQMDINWDKKLFLMNTPINWKLKKRSSQTDELVMLLNQQVQKKINWEHEKILLNNKSQQYPNLSPQDIQVDLPASRSLINIQFYINQLNQPISEIKEEIKTPDLVDFIQVTSPAKIQLQFSSETKRQEKDHPHQNQSKCNCKKSQCLKLYCQCFRAGRQCVNCDCKGCKNNSDSHQERKLAIKMIQQRQPAAFSNTGRYKGCRCTKSQCLKGYCQCFVNGHICGKYCKCRDCANNKNYWRGQKKKNQKNRY